MAETTPAKGTPEYEEYLANKAVHLDQWQKGKYFETENMSNCDEFVLIDLESKEEQWKKSEAER